MTKLEAVKYIIKNINPKEGHRLFREILSTRALEELLIGLETEQVNILRGIIGNNLMDAILRLIQEDEAVLSEDGFAGACKELLAAFEYLQNSGAIAMTFPEEESKVDPEKNTARTRTWLSSQAGVS